MQLQSSQKEVEAAENSLVEAEERWDVIDVDDQGPDSPTNNDHSKKRRKITLSPPPHDGSTAAAAGGLTVDEDALESSMRIFGTSLTGDARQALREAIVSSMRHPSGAIDADCLQHAMTKGVPREVALNAAYVSRVGRVNNTIHPSSEARSAFDLYATGKSSSSNSAAISSEARPAVTRAIDLYSRRESSSI